MKSTPSRASIDVFITHYFVSFFPSTTIATHKRTQLHAHAHFVDILWQQIRFSTCFHSSQQQQHQSTNHTRSPKQDILHHTRVRQTIAQSTTNLQMFNSTLCLRSFFISTTNDSKHGASEISGRKWGEWRLLACYADVHYFIINDNRSKILPHAISTSIKVYLQMNDNALWKTIGKQQMHDHILVSIWHRARISGLIKISSMWFKAFSFFIDFMCLYVLLMFHNKGAFDADRFTILALSMV